MLSRRRFLASSGIGMLALSPGCRPAFGQTILQADVPSLSDDFRNNLQPTHQRNRLLGYPINMNTPHPAFFRWRDELCRAGIDQFAYNNVGNPFKQSPIPFNTHDYERQTIIAFGRLLGFPTDDTWGFLSNSGTDSNMHGMYMGRTILKGRTGRIPKAYYTREAHYSVQILSDLLGLEHEQVATLADGGLDPDDLQRRLSRDPIRPALVVATIGTTFKGAIDDIDQIQDRLRGHESYLHLDAALFGGYLPFTSHRDIVSFARGTGDRKARYDSIAVSCHKFFGFPNPAGLYLTRRSMYEEFNTLFSRIHNPEYIHQVPGTITCSRDATKPAEFFYYTTPRARRKQTEDATAMLDNTSYLLDVLNSEFPRLLARRANNLSNTVYFRNPGESIVEKYSLATMTIDEGGRPAEFAHVVVMPHVSRHVLNEFLGDISP
jgi:glutamate/tyrosine decarboxylase-like PLP-dependent enzyme